MNKEDALYDELCLAIYNSNRYLHRLYQSVLGEYDLTYLQYLSILVIWQEDGLGVQLKDICKRLDLLSNTLTPVVDKLVKKGWLIKQASLTDKRAKELVLADDRKAEFAEILKKVNDLQLKLTMRTNCGLNEMLTQQHDLNNLLIELITKENEYESSTN